MTPQVGMPYTNEAIAPARRVCTRVDAEAVWLAAARKDGVPVRGAKERPIDREVFERHWRRA